MNKITYKKLNKGEYEVYADGEHVGYVFSREGFSYRGTEGWNRGIRCQDFYPIEWRYSTTGVGLHHTNTYGRRTRKAAVEALLSTLKQEKSC